MAERRKLRSDCRVGTAEKKLGLPSGSIRNPSSIAAICTSLPCENSNIIVE